MWYTQFMLFWYWESGKYGDTMVPKDPANDIIYPGNNCKILKTISAFKRIRCYFINAIKYLVIAVKRSTNTSHRNTNVSVKQMVSIQCASGSYSLLVSVILYDICIYYNSTHLSLDKMVAISQRIFSDALLWMKYFVFWLKFHWNLFLRV